MNAKSSPIPTRIHSAHLSRRRLITLASGLVVAGCAGSAGRESSDASPATSGAPTSSLPSATTSDTGVVTSLAAPPGLEPDDRVLVLVELAGGNDAVNTFVPVSPRYHDLRSSIALADEDLLSVVGYQGHGWHPALAPLVPFAESGRLAAIAGIGYRDPDLSHFVSFDRWWRADRLDDDLGWLGRWLDTLEGDLAALDATAIGHDGDVLRGLTQSGTVIDSIDSFALPSEVSASAVRALSGWTTDDDGSLFAAAQAAHLATVGAVEEFDAIADDVRAGRDEPEQPYGPRGAGFTSSLNVAAELIINNPGTRVVTVSVNGFDTHAEQLATHEGLLADLATGLAEFWSLLEEVGQDDRVLVATQSEFGRRVRENGSNGCDHGAAGLVFLMGNSIEPGLYGEIDVDDLAGDDLEPRVDPRTMFTACLDWLGADVEKILGQRYDELALLA